MMGLILAFIIVNTYKQSKGVAVCCIKRVEWSLCVVGRCAESNLSRRTETSQRRLNEIETLGGFCH